MIRFPRRRFVPRAAGAVLLGCTLWCMDARAQDAAPPTPIDVPPTEDPPATPVETPPVPVETPPAQAEPPASVEALPAAEVPPTEDSPAARVEAPPAETPPPDVPFIDIHAFVSQGFLWTTDNNYLASSESGSVEFTEAGINFTKALTPDLRVGLQLFARDLGPIGNYSAKFDWYYLDYRWTDWLGVRAGRVKLPYGLYNEVSDIDAARTFVLLPQGLYPTRNRDFLLAQTGIEIYGFGSLGGAGALDYRLYVGTIFLETDTAPGSPEVEALSVPYVTGGRLFWHLPLEGLRAGGSVQILKLEGTLLYDSDTWMPLQMMGSLPATFDGNVDFDLPATLWAGSIEYAAYDFLFAVEYGRWHVKPESSAPVLFPEEDTTSERAHVMLSYRVTNWFEPGAYYSLYFPDVDDRKGREAQQHDVALALRFDLNSFWLVKVEGHVLSGTASLESRLNDGRSKDELKRNWGLLLAKTTAYF